MTPDQLKALMNPERARIFRIIHRDNLPWLLKNGVHCRSSNKADPAYVNIGNSDLIEKRRTRNVEFHPGGTLSDYVPFYFTPFSTMAYNIHTGFSGVRKRSNKEILILTTTLHRLQEYGVRFIFSDRHAYLETAEFSSDVDDLGRMITWGRLQARDFRRTSMDDLTKFERYQAEALVHKIVPIASLAGVACYDDETVEGVAKLTEQMGIQLKAAPKPEWYF